MTDSSRLLSGAGKIPVSPGRMAPFVSDSAGREQYRQSPLFVSKTRSGRMPSAPQVVGDEILPANDANFLTPGSSEQMRADCVVACAVLRAIENDGFTLVMLPIHNPDPDGDVLYFECAVWCRALVDEMLSPRMYLECLARVGLMSHFDRYVLTRVLSLLEQSPHLSIGVNLSGDSLSAGLQWESLFVHLHSSPDLARRLVVQVAENVEIEKGAGRTFLGRLRQLGCRVAIDGYGVTYGVDVGTEIPWPDIVKIGPSFIKAAQHGDVAKDKLKRLVKLGASVARDVVVLGGRDGC
ncbi:EAL domain-containing protein [Burkholderia pyrrocinia]|uniref:EAL domain-containing protein n=1 Tax=Burkholderia pyrrocinia TaxID=60550 RepID=UPI001BCA7D93|nr:EAL domain-containing protein [Burkholderia pyrrocinia]QVN21290.1 EAL domain-containing protein [Burkholderia pyrrocinia]